MAVSGSLSAKGATIARMSSSVVYDVSAGGCDASAEEDMSATERELADDAAWKRIQQNTFTRCVLGYRLA